VSTHGRGPGALALVLHTHMPYVVGYGTWPFGEEWLWEAIATSYLRVLPSVSRAPITLSITPVLADQLEDPGAQARCLDFLRTIRPESHRRDAATFQAAGETVLAAEVQRSATEYADAAAQLAALPDGLLGALAPRVSWTSAATHAILPLLASETCLCLQLHTGIASHRRRFGSWAGGLWLPECAHAAWLDPELEAAGVSAVCIELTRAFGLGDPRHLAPLGTEDGPLLWPLDRAAIALVWSDRGYPCAPAYRDYHAHTQHHHRVWRNDGGAYDVGLARAQAAVDACDFVTRVRRRVAEGGVCVCALDTELLGHWWYEGPWWLEAVIEESARQGLRLVELDDAPSIAAPVPAPAQLPVTSWGEGGDLRTWSGPQVGDLAWQARSVELAVLAGGGRPPNRALRELLALQSSAWAFLASRRTAGEYPRERAAGHAEAVRAALRGEVAGGPEPAGLAPDLAGWWE
jgi:1,4-alpha-glucan branching enzyme